jgi:hypothetical protein
MRFPMSTYYVFDRVLLGPASAENDPTDRLSKASNGNYMVASSTLSLKRVLIVFDAYEPASDYFDRLSNPLKNYMHRLWKVSALTEKGAAKKCMKFNGAVVRLAQQNANPKQEVIRAVLLHAMEQHDASNSELGELHRELMNALGEKLAGA